MSKKLKKNTNHKKNHNKSIENNFPKNEVEPISKDLMVPKSEILEDSNSNDLVAISSEIIVGSDGYGNTNDTSNRNNLNSNSNSNSNNVEDSNINSLNSDSQDYSINKDYLKKIKTRCFGRLRKYKELQEDGLLITNNEIIFPDNDTETIIRTNRIFYNITIIFSIFIAFFLLIFKSSIKALIIANHLDSTESVVISYFILLLIFLIFKKTILNNIITKVFKFYKVIDFEKKIAYSKVVSKIYTYKYNVIPFNNILEVANNTILDKSIFMPIGRSFIEDRDFKYHYYYYEFLGIGSEVLCRSTNTVCFLIRKGRKVQLYNFYTLKKRSGYSTLSNSSIIAMEIGSLLNLLFGIKYKNLEKYNYSVETQMIVAENNNNYYLEEVEFNPSIENRFIIFFKVISGLLLLLPAIIISLFLFGIYCSILMK